MQGIHPARLEGFDGLVFCESPAGEQLLYTFSLFYVIQML